MLSYNKNENECKVICWMCLMSSSLYILEEMSLLDSDNSEFLCYSNGEVGEGWLNWAVSLCIHFYWFWFCCFWEPVKDIWI